MKDSFKDILLIPLAAIINIISAFFGHTVLWFCNRIIIDKNFDDTSLDQLLGDLAVRSFESLMLIGFLYFLFIDFKTLISRNIKQCNELAQLEKYSSSEKLLLNKAFNIFKNVPFENNSLTSIKIYFLRILLIIIVILPLYVFQFFLFLFSLAPFTIPLFTLVILLGGALLYQFDTKVGKLLELYFIKFIEKIKPDKIELLKKDSNT
jgi:magnesium-transporting ATPase (P-type)